MAERDKDAIRARCARSLSNDPPARRRPRRVLEALAALTPADAEPDVYGAGALIASFEAEVAALLGKESAAFMPSGTMAQQIALRVWSERRRCPTVAFHPTCHLELHEERGYQHLHGLRARLVGAPDAPMTLGDLERVDEPIAALLVELPQREIGGTLPTWEELQATAAWARARGAALHLDGARLWECGPFYGRSYAELCAPFDSVYVSAYKGLGGIAGCLLAGPRDFVAEARVWQRRHGGTLVSVWPLVLAARAGLAERLPKMARYRERAAALAARLGRLDGVQLITPQPPPTNLLHLRLRGDRQRLEQAALDLAEARGVWLFGKLQPTGSPDWQRLELTCAEGALELSDDEVAGLLAELLARG